jgi:hypothetical protein|tara:strand:+ start:1132 stop:1377 length:246 start_codon:yes stop_codon:yes gene_type:complete
MYDKYFQATPITIGSKIPKHKGILFSGSLVAGAGVTLSLVNTSGVTFNTVITFDNTPNFFPMQVYAIPNTLPTGMTAYYVN